MTLIRGKYKNFQKHRARTVDFDPRVTVVVGSTDSGKTSLVRGLRWLMLNQPNKKPPVTTGKSNCSVELVTSAGTVTRIRGRGGNVYKLGKKVYKSFGAKVPGPVEHVLNVREDNFQDQLDGPLWFLDSPGQVSKKLNRIVNLDEIDRATARAAAYRRSAEAGAEVTKARLDKAEARMAELSHVPEFLRDLARLERLGKRAAASSQKRAALSVLSSGTIRALRKQRTAVAGAAVAGKLLAFCERWAKTRRKQDDLRNKLQALQVVSTRAAEALPDIGPLTNLRADADALAERRRTLEMLVDRLTRAEEDRCDVQRKLTGGEAELRKALSGRCPACGRGTSSPSPSATSTSSPTRRPAGRKKTGTASRRNTSGNSGG